MKTLNTIVRTAAAAVATCACLLACAWPTQTEADDYGQRQADIGSNTTKIGHIQTTSRLVEDTNVKGKWYLEIVATNTSDTVETAEIEEQVLKESYQSMMARSGPIPTVAWKVNEKVQVLPRETAVVRHPLPAWLSAQVAAAMAPPKLNKQGEPIMVARASFLTAVDSRAPATPPRSPDVQVAQAQQAPLKASKRAGISPQSRGRNYSMP